VRTCRLCRKGPGRWSERDKDWKKQGTKHFYKDYEDQSEADNLERGSLASSDWLIKECTISYNLRALKELVIWKRKSDVEISIRGGMGDV